MTRRPGNVAAVAFVSLVLVFLFLPVVVVVLFSFNDAASTSLPIKGLSLRWYRAAFDNDKRKAEPPVLPGPGGAR